MSMCINLLGSLGEAALAHYRDVAYVWRLVCVCKNSGIFCAPILYLPTA